MRENRQSGSEGGAAQTNALSLPLSVRLLVTLFCGRVLSHTGFALRYLRTSGGLALGNPPFVLRYRSTSAPCRIKLTEQ
jgi:hypothetical protein